MVHSSHIFRIYKKRVHILITFGILVLPILFILFAGKISNLSTHSLILGLGISLTRLAIAYLVSLVLAIFLAVLLGQGKLGNFFVPVFDLLQNMPSFAMIPIFILLLGRTDTMAILFAITSMLWPILFYVIGSFRNARTELNEAATLFGATGWKRVIHYLIPLSFPSILIGSLVSVSIGWEAIIGIELIGLNNGIGIFLNSVPPDQKNVLILGIISLLLVVFSINKLVWMPLLRKSQSYGE